MSMKKAEAVRKDFDKTISEVQNTKNTAERRALLNIALRQNDLIYTYEKARNGGVG